MHIRPPQKNRNNNNRNKNGRKPMGNTSNRVYESAGPEGKVRGTPQQIIEKYLLLARDSQTSGDRVTAENFLQHAEHYIRLLSASQVPGEERRPSPQFAGSGRSDYDDGGYDDDDDDGSSQPSYEPAAAERQPGGDRQGGDRQGGDRQGGDRRGERHDRQQHDRAAQHRPHQDRPAHERPQHDRLAADHHEMAQPSRAETAPADDAAVGAPAPVEAVGLASALETIDARDEAETNLVATPESAGDEPVAKKPADGRRRRRRAPGAEAGAAESPAPADEAQVG